MEGFLPPVVVSLLANTSGFTAQMGKAKAEMGAVASKAESMAAVGKRAFLGLSVAAVGVGAAAVKMASDFDQAMERVHTQAGAAQSAIKPLSDAVLNLAPKVGASPEELAKSLYHVESAFASTGITAKDAMDMVKLAAEGAAIGGSDLETTTQAVIGTMAAGLPDIHSATDAMAALNQTVGSGDTTMQKLALSIGTGVLPTFKTAGLGMKDYSAAIATITDNVTPADEAATRLRMTISLMEAPTDKAKKALKSVGISQTQLAMDMRQPNGLLLAVQDIRTHLGKLGTDAEKIAATQVLEKAFGGGRTSGSILTLIDEVDRLRSKYAEYGTEAQRTAKFQDAWAEQQKQFAQKVNDLKASLERLLIIIGNDLIPVLESAAGWITHHIGLVETLAGIIAGALVASIVLWVGKTLWAVGANVAAFAGWVAKVVSGNAAVEASNTATTAVVVEEWQAAAISMGASMADFAAVADGELASVAGAAGIAGAEAATAFRTSLMGGLGGLALLGVGAIPDAIKVPKPGEIQSSIAAAQAANPGVRYGYNGNGKIVPVGQMPVGVTGTHRTDTADMAAGYAGAPTHRTDYADMAATYVDPLQKILDGLKNMKPPKTPMQPDKVPGGGGGSTPAVDKYEPFRTALSAFGTRESAAFADQANLTTQKQVKAAEKADAAIKALAVADRRHMESLVKAAKTAKDKAAATTLLATAQGQVNAATRQLTTVQQQGIALQLQAAQKALALANAKINAGIDYSNPISVAQAAVATAQNTVNADMKNKGYKNDPTYYNDLASLHQAQAGLIAALAAAVTATTSNTTATVDNTQAMLVELPTYEALRYAVNAGAYTTPSGPAVTVTVQGSLMGSTPSEVAGALVPHLVPHLSGYQRNNAIPASFGKRPGAA